MSTRDVVHPKIQGVFLIVNTLNRNHSPDIEPNCRKFTVFTPSPQVQGVFFDREYFALLTVIRQMSNQTAQNLLCLLKDVVKIC